MPAEVLFDISAIDLNARVADREAIARTNPHRGLMALLDGIIWHDAPLDQGVAISHARPDAFWAPGHIPGRPIMPGVLMIEAGAQLASWMYYQRSGEKSFAGFTHIDEVAFRGMVVPGDDLVLLVKCIRYNPKRFTSGIQGLVNGQIVFSGRISGMVFPSAEAAKPVGAGRSAS
ncbi:MAG TPA: hypothetical protein VG797_10920 [Phycisphaerales bacterium]|nr:hypothetical protein [Phycisphaerales bacterium]